MLKNTIIFVLLIIGSISAVAAVASTNCGNFHYVAVCYYPETFIAWVIAFISLAVGMYLLVITKITYEQEKNMRHYNLFEFGEKNYTLNQNVINIDDFMLQYPLDLPSNA